MRQETKSIHFSSQYKVGRSKRWTFWNTSTGALESFRVIQTKIQQKWAGLQPEGQRNQKLGLLLSSLWCFIFGPDVYVVSLQTSCSFICCVSQMSIILHRAICPGVKTSNISTIDSAFILFIYFFLQNSFVQSLFPSKSSVCVFVFYLLFESGLTKPLSNSWSPD